MYLADYNNYSATTVSAASRTPRTYGLHPYVKIEAAVFSAPLFLFKRLCSSSHEGGCLTDHEGFAGQDKTGE